MLFWQAGDNGALLIGFFANMDPVNRYAAGQVSGAESRLPYPVDRNRKQTTGDFD